MGVSLHLSKVNIDHSHNSLHVSLSLKISVMGIKNWEFPVVSIYKIIIGLLKHLEEDFRVQLTELYISGH